MEPPLSSPRLRHREKDDGRSLTTESKSWAPVEKTKTARCYTHNTRHFIPRDAEPTVAVEEEAEPALRPPPTWMLLLAGAAIAALLSVLVGGLYLEF